MFILKLLSDQIEDFFLVYFKLLFVVIIIDEQGE